MTSWPSALLRPIAALGLLIALAPSARADEPQPAASRLFTASDIPHLAEGTHVPLDGRYTLKVWAPARQSWSLKADGQTLTLSGKVEGDDASPRWQVVGDAELKAAEPVKIIVPWPKPRPALPKAKAKAAPLRPRPRRCRPCSS